MEKEMAMPVDGTICRNNKINVDNKI
jgi:hypothetical protein